MYIHGTIRCKNIIPRNGWREQIWFMESVECNEVRSGDPKGHLSKKYRDFGREGELHDEIMMRLLVS